VSDSTGNPPQSKRPALPWLVLAVFALVLAAGLNYFMKWSLQFFAVNAALPGGLMLVHNLRTLTYALPVAFCVMAKLAIRWPRASGVWPVMLSLVGLTTLHLIVCYWVMVVGVGYGTGMTPHRLPSEVRTLIEQADRLEVLSIWPAYKTKVKPPAPIVGDFVGYPVLGRVEVTNAVTRSEVIKAFLVSVDTSQGPKLLCFDPHHALRAVRHSEKVDLVICYGCGFAEVRYGGDRREVGVSSVSKAKLNEVLAAAGAPLAPEPTKKTSFKPEVPH
jgi:hypothetical protein